MKNVQKVGDKWRFRKLINGKLYSKYYDYKPTQTDILQDLSLIRDREKRKRITLSEASYKYLSVKDKELSPTTYYGYLRVIKTLEKTYPDFMKKYIYDFEKIDIQEFINTYSSSHKPKSVKNVYSLIMNIIQLFRDDFKPKITLPKNIKEDPYIPTDKDIEFLLTNIKNTELEIPIKLGLMGMRISEVLGLTLNDINFETGEIKINKAKVRGYSGDVIKSTKTQSSIRTIKVDKEITDKIKAQGYICNKQKCTIEKFLLDFHKFYHIPHYSFHKLRHRFASKMIDMGMPITSVQKLGGWENGSSVLLRIYSHHLEDKTSEYQDMALKCIPKV